MGKTAYTVIAIVVTAMVFGMYTGFRAINNVGDFTSEPYLSTDEQIEKFLGNNPSEDMKHLLKVPTLAEDEEYGLTGQYAEYWVYLDGAKDIGRVEDLFYELYEETDFEWEIYYKNNDQWESIYAYDGEVVISSEWVCSLYLKNWDEQSMGEEEFKEFAKFVDELAERLKVKVRYEESIESGLARSKEISELNERYGRYVIFELRAGEGRAFTGRQIHDAAISLGLEWEYGEYNWANPSETVGSYAFFNLSNTDMETSFVPEEMAEDDYAVQSLTFSFYLPFTPATVEVYDSMLAAVQYYQQRFGGTLYDENDNELDAAGLTALREEVGRLAKELEDMGYRPGYWKASLVF